MNAKILAFCFANRLHDARNPGLTAGRSTHRFDYPCETYVLGIPCSVVAIAALGCIAVIADISVCAWTSLVRRQRKARTRHFAGLCQQPNGSTGYGCEILLTGCIADRLLARCV